MNISAINANSPAQDVGGSQQTDFRARMEQAMAPVAQLFGTTPDQLMDAVRQSGGSLADYAASKGISTSDLTAAIKKGLQDNAPNGVQLSDTQLTNIANRIENHKPGQHHHHGPPAADSAGASTATGTTTGTATNSASTIAADLEKLITDLGGQQL